jgi:uncharacterized low-complexity protein
MSKTFSRTPLALALGAAFTLAGGSAQASVFQVADLAAGYMVASAGDEKKGEAEKTGTKELVDKAACDKMKAEGKCGEGKCGGGACDLKSAKEGQCGAGHAEKSKEGKCGGKK